MRQKERLERSLEIARDLGHLNLIKSPGQAYICQDCGVYIFPDHGRTKLGLFGPWNDHTWPPLVHFANQYDAPKMWVFHLEGPGPLMYSEATTDGNTRAAIPTDAHRCKKATARVPCQCGDGSCMLCDDNGMVPVSDSNPHTL